MNPFLSKEMARQHIRDLRYEARKIHGLEKFPELETDGVTVRAAQPRDRDAVRLLAALDGQHMPTGDLLVAEVGGELAAALPLDGGKPLADPFRHTAHIVAMLELRAKQLRPRAGRSRESLLDRLRRVPRAA